MGHGLKPAKPASPTGVHRHNLSAARQHFICVTFAVRRPLSGAARARRESENIHVVPCALDSDKRTGVLFQTAACDALLARSILRI
jgi:hypothetical protein